ncbi:hypothetical protein [Streptomyces sp. NPDC017993]|uniref:hypothetical protein n=1 Tax=Streptomyces sp. NPDC017993 TaxID=3365027 RepID=UPI0037AB60C0
MRRPQRAFIVVNAGPLAVAIVLYCIPQLSGTEVFGQITLGITWGLLQLGLFISTSWWYENRSSTLCDAGNRSPDSVRPQAKTSGIAHVSETGQG